jgi:dihydrofolate reductase
VRELVYTGFMSLDGVVDSPGGTEEGHRSGGWVVDDLEFVPEAWSLKGEELADTTALLLGRRSYEAFAPFWRESEDHVAYKDLPKYVVSTTLTDDALVDGWGPTTILRSAEEVAELKKGGWRDLHPRQRRACPPPVGRGAHRPVQPAGVPGAARWWQEPVQHHRQGQADAEAARVRGLPERHRQAGLRGPLTRREREGATGALA